MKQTSPNHALQRTPPAVTPAASAAAFPPAVQPARPGLLQSLSLRSLGSAVALHWIMSIMRYVVGVVGFLLCWTVIAFLSGLAMAIIFPPQLEQVMIGIGLNWRNLPGAILGSLAGIHSFRASTGAPRR